MITEYEDSSSKVEKLGLLIFIVGIVIGNTCVFITFFMHSDGKHWSNVVILAMAFIDLFIGSFVLPLRYISAYAYPLTSKLCVALRIGESCALAAMIYAICLMIYIRLYSLKQPSLNIRRCYVLIGLLLSWMVSFLFYGIPLMINDSNSILLITSTIETSNVTSYCKSFAASVYHSPWMAYTEIGMIYLLPLLFISIGLIHLLYYLCQPRPRQLRSVERKTYLEEQKMTWHVFLIGITFISLWIPWISFRILIIFYHIVKIQVALQITYYILILKSVLFPILYAATNASFRGSFAMYKHQRITFNTRVCTIDEQFRYSVKHQRGY